jgi:hypothetical protein
VERIAAVVVLVVVMVTQWQLVATRERLARAETRADSIAADAAIDAIRRDSVWSATVASTERDLAQAISERDSTSAALVARLDDASIRIAMLTDLSAKAKGEVESLAQRSTVLTDSLTALADTVERWEGEIDDGLLTATWRFDLPPARHTLTYGVTIPGELVVSETGDGRAREIDAPESIARHRRGRRVGAREVRAARRVASVSVGRAGWCDRLGDGSLIFFVLGC